MKTRAEPLQIEIVVGDLPTADFSGENYFGLLVQCPDTRGRIIDPSDHLERAHASGTLCVVATDLLALTMLKSPGEMGADIAIGNSQRFGVPWTLVGHRLHSSQHDSTAASCRDGLVFPKTQTTDRLTARHFRRASSISAVTARPAIFAQPRCSSPLWPAHAVIMAHGLRSIGCRVHGLAQPLKQSLVALGFKVGADAFFDTIVIETKQADFVHGTEHGFNLA